ncbi:hypothetical protein Tco_1220979 [Tanacetum coccineum]
MGLDVGSLLSTPIAQDPSTATKSVSDPEPLSYAKPQPYPEQDIAQSSKGTATEILTEDVATAEVNVHFSVGSPELGRSIFAPSVVGSPGGIYQPRWGVTNECRLDTPDACQDIVDHIVPPGYFSELHHLPNADFLIQYNINLVRQVAMGSQLRLRFEQEVWLLKKARSKISRWDQRIQVREEEIKKLDHELQSLRDVESEVHGLQNQTKNLKTLLEAEVDMKKAAEAKNAELAKELDSLSVKFLDLQFSNNRLSEQMDARMDKLSVDFDEDLYQHMLTVIAGYRWVIGHDLHLAVMKCVESSEIRQAIADVVSVGLAKGMSEGLKYGIEHGKAGRDLADVEAYESEANSKESYRGRCPSVDLSPLLELFPTKDPRIPEIRDPGDPWAAKEEVLLEDAIMANISQVEKKKKCRVVCRTHGISFAHHARSDGILVSAPTVPQGLAILLADAATQTKAANKEEEPHPRLHRSIYLPHVYDL